jgi:prevent-host-death family protein
MPVVGLRQLSRKTRAVIDQLETGEPVVITDQGRPIAALVALTEQEAAPYALAVAPDFVASRERAEQAIQAGEGKPGSEVLQELKALAEGSQTAERDTPTAPETEEEARESYVLGAARFSASAAIAASAAAVGTSSPLGFVTAFALPNSLLDHVVRAALDDSKSAALETPAVRQVNERLAETLLRESLANVVSRVRAVNANIVAEVGGADDQASLTTYVSELEQVATAEHRALSGLECSWEGRS